MPWAGLRLAITLLTAVPLPGRPLGAPSAARPRPRCTGRPLVGLALGAAAAGVLLACRAGHAGSLLGAVLAIAVLAALTRGLHLDGLADLADGLGSRTASRASRWRS